MAKKFLQRSATLVEMPSSETGAPRQFRHRHADQTILFEFRIIQGIRFETGQLQIFGFKAVRIDDQDATFFEVAQVCHQGRRIHRDKGIQTITGRKDLFR